MYDNIQMVRQEGTMKNYTLVLEKDINDLLNPKDLFRNGNITVSFKDLLEWIEWEGTPKR